jgi:hypothetical protein
MANEISTLPLVYQCVLCEWRWTEEQPQQFNTSFDAAVMFVGAGACPSCSAARAMALQKAS